MRQIAVSSLDDIDGDSVKFVSRIVNLLELTELYPSIEHTEAGDVDGFQFWTHAGTHFFIWTLYISKIPLPKSPLRSFSRTENSKKKNTQKIQIANSNQ